MNLEHLHLQYDRLARHHEAALRHKDPISFLDLAHALRIWVDMKALVTEMARAKSIRLQFGHFKMPRAAKEILRGSQYTYLPLAAGVASPGVEVRGLRITNRALSPEEIKKLAAMGPPQSTPSTMTFQEWLAAGVFLVPSDDPTHPQLQLSREILVRRIANILGASHPAGMETEDPTENRFDKYILDLHSIALADGYPATYYQLLEIAGEVLFAAKPLREQAT